MKFSPRAYQINAAEHLLTNPKSLLFLDLGLGKTVISLSYAQYLHKNNKIQKTLIVAPLRPVYSVWPTEINKWDHINLSYTILHGPEKDNKLKENKDIYLINYEGLRWLYYTLRRKKFPFDCVVIDESSFVKNPRTKRFLYLRIICLYAKYRILLSGSIAPNSLLDIWSQYYLLDEGKRLGPSHGEYKQKYFMPIDYNQHTWVLKPNQLPIISKKISDITLRMRNTDYLDLPEKITNDLYCELPFKLRKQYDTLEKEFFLELENAEIQAFSLPALSMKLRQFLAGAVYTEEMTAHIHKAKIDTLKEIKDAYPNPVLAAIQFRFEYDLICTQFPKAPVIYGGVPMSLTLELINKWNNQELPLLIVHPQSIAHGLNLQAGGCYLLWMNLPWSYEQYHQLNGRLHRSGQTKPVIINRIIFKNTMDETVARTLYRKMNTETSFSQELLKEIKFRKA